MNRITLLSMLLLTVSLAAHADSVHVSFLANEGVMINNGDDYVMIDGFLTELSYNTYGYVTGKAGEQLLAAEGPFSSVDLALASHVHLDHFQPKAALGFLRNSRSTVFASSPQVIDALKQHADDELADLKIKSLWTDPGKSVSIENAGIKVKAFPLSHGTGRFAEFQNLGHLISVGGMNILHIGDAAMNADNFSEAKVDEFDIDIALIPYWYFQSEDGLAIIERFLKSDYKIALHIPPKEYNKVWLYMSDKHPEVVLFDETMKTHHFKKVTD